MNLELPKFWVLIESSCTSPIVENAFATSTFGILVHADNEGSETIEQVGYIDFISIDRQPL